MNAGMKIVVSPLLPMRCALKKLPPKPWHRNRGYAQRVRKKWEKRYGTDLVHCLFSDNGKTAIVSASAYAELQRGKS